MLTWINENAKWVIAIFAVGIILGLLAMDRTPSQAHQYPIARVNGESVPYAEFDVRVKKIVENRFKNQHLDDQQYMQLREQVLRTFVQQTLLQKRFQENGLVASVFEMKAELRNNPQVVRNMVGEEAQARLYAIQSSSQNQADAQKRIQTYIATLPKFLLDTAFDQGAYDQWLETPSAYEWACMENYEQELKTMDIPVRQLQLFVTANAHPTSLEAEWNVKNRLTEHDLEVASVSSDDFPAQNIDSAMVKAYFNAHPDSFFVDKDYVKVEYAVLPVTATAKDESKIREYAMTLYEQLKDTSTTASFADMAKVASEDESTAANGGVIGDYTPRGTWEKPFEDAAFALDSGAISEPVRTKYGYHIIQSLGKKKDSTGAETVKAAHILLTVTASTETLDSLDKILTVIKDSVENGKVDFAAAAKAKGVPVRTSGWVARGDMIPELGYLGGFSAYAFVNKDRPDLSSDKVSAVLKNKEYTLVAIKVDSLFAGDRSVALYEDQIKNDIRLERSADSAAHYLTSVADKVMALPVPAASTPDTSAADSAVAAAAALPGNSAGIDKVKVDRITASFEGFVPGIGYATPQLYSILSKQKEGQWGSIVKTDRGAVMVKVLSKKAPDAAAMQTAVRDELANSWRFAYSSLFNDYVSGLENGAKVESNIDLYFRD